MFKKTDILIIGGGAIGICCAHYLNSLGREVTLVEKGEIGGGASYGNAGLVIPGQSIPLAAPGVISKGLRWMLNPESPFYIKPQLNRDFLHWLWKFSRFCTPEHLDYAVPILRDLQHTSMALFKELMTLEGIDLGFEQKGVLDAYLSNKEFEKGKETARLLEKFGLENQILDRKEVDELFAGFRTKVVGGVYYTMDAHLDPARFVRALAEHSGQKGTVILPDTEVIGMHKNGRKVTAVQTTRGIFKANEIILAGGAWSPPIVSDLKLKLHVQAAKGYSITYKRPANFPDIPFILVEAKVAITPMDDILRFAGTLELAGLDQTINRRRVDAILKSVPRYLPDLNIQKLELVEIWRGLRPCTPDGLPYIARPVNYDNLIIATGHAMKGISLAPVTGKLVAQLAMRQKPDMDISGLKIERFSKKI